MAEILVVDRDPISVRATLTHLQAYDVQVATTFSQARDLQRSHGYRLIILSVYTDAFNTPGMIESLYEINDQVRIVAVGDQSSLDLERTVRLSKVFFYMIRPIDFSELKAVIKRALAEENLVGS